MSYMDRIRNFLRLPAEDRALLVQSAFLLLAIRLALWVLPFRALWRIVEAVTPRRPLSPEADGVHARRIAWAVKRASRVIPAATCLTQAVGAQILLARCGVPYRLHIGVARGESQRLLAHAWVESQGRVVVGGGSLDHYTSLLVLERGRF